jgi:ATP-dependent helicase/DNAse subunit B
MNMLDIARYIKESLDHSVFFRDFEFIYEDGTYKIYICEIVKDFELQLEEK